MKKNKTISINSLFESLDAIELQIASVCRSKGVAPDELELHLDSFSLDEEDLLLDLLNKSVSVQKAIFKAQGGCLENVVFLSPYR